MAKSSHLNIIFLFFPVMILIPSTICVLYRAPEVSCSLTTETIASLTDTRISPADTPVQKAISALPTFITIGDFKFRIVNVVFDETATGFVPVDMGLNDQVMFVEFELLKGNKDAFKGLKITVADGSGQKSNAFILTSGGMMQMLATVVMKSASSYYQPGEDNIAWAYVVPRGVDELYLNFPTGEIVDLTLLIKSFSCVVIRLCHEYRDLDSRFFYVPDEQIIPYLGIGI